MGGELPTPPLALETGLEVGADLDAAKSPQISRQQGVPPAAPQPPLSKAVRTSPKRPPPSGRTPNEDLLSRFGYGGYFGEDETSEPIGDLLTRYGYRSQSTPPVLDRPPLKRYGYYPTVSSGKHQAESPRGDPEAADQSGLWWVVLMSGIAAFAGGFFGKFLGGKASDATDAT